MVRNELIAGGQIQARNVLMVQLSAKGRCVHFPGQGGLEFTVQDDARGGRGAGRGAGGVGGAEPNKNAT